MVPKTSAVQTNGKESKDMVELGYVGGRVMRAKRFADRTVQ